VESIPEITNNEILSNKSTGLMLLQYSNTRVVANTIRDNDGVGLYLRDFSKGDFRNNEVGCDIVTSQICLNEIELVVEMNKPLLAEIQEKNRVIGDVRPVNQY